MFLSRVFKWGSCYSTFSFQWGSCYSIFSFICMFCKSLFVLLYFFLLFIVLSVLLQYTDSDYPFGICKLFLEVLYICNTRSNLNGLILFTKMYFYITDCTPDPCVHGTCANSIHGFTCSCNTGYTGHICDQGID